MSVKAGIPDCTEITPRRDWMPACAGMTNSDFGHSFPWHCTELPKPAIQHQEGISQNLK